jgi:hypothetical protein
MPETITSNDGQYAFEIVKAICSEVGPGIAGSSQERERAEYIKKELVSHLGTKNVVVEEFTFAPAAFLGSQLISTLCMLTAVVLNIVTGLITGIQPWLTVIAALVLSISSILIFILEFVLGLELVDPIFKQKTSVNVIGTLRKPGTKSVKRLLILSGHHDSAVEFTWLRLTGFGYFILIATWLIAIITVLVMNTIQLWGVIAGNADIIRIGTIGWIPLIYPIVPALIFAVFFQGERKNGGTVPGAVDNLAASALTVAMCRFLVNNPGYIPADTEIRCISFGGEESGVRGSRRYVKRHLDELQRLDAQVLNFEMVAHSVITILTSEANGTVKNSPAMVQSVVDAAERAGVPYKVQPASLGMGSDAGPFSQAGLKAATLYPFKFPQQTVAFYHQRKDSTDVLTLEPLLNVLRLTFEWIRSNADME